jgi:hypothetical protein
MADFIITNTEGPIPINIEITETSRGPAGVGVPDGGTTGQVLAKASADDYDTEWADVSGAVDQTAIQNDFLDDLAECQGVAYEKLGPEIAPSPNEAPNKAARTQKLINIFSDCMKTKGWTIPVPEGKAPPPPQPAPVALKAAPPMISSLKLPPKTASKKSLTVKNNHCKKYH